MLLQRLPKLGSKMKIGKIYFVYFYVKINLESNIPGRLICAKMC